ncbi:putative receptor-like protein kinase, partial [Ananas comosus]
MRAARPSRCGWACRLARPATCDGTACPGFEHFFWPGLAWCARQRNPSITVGSVCLLLIALFFFIYLPCKKHWDLKIFSKKISEDERRVEAILQTYDLKAPKRYKYSQIKKITQRFNNEIGKGGFGTVFKGKLIDGQEVAVKDLHQSNGKDKSNMEASIVWERLHDIAIGIARGLEYLHHKKFRPQIADFGLAKLCFTRKSTLSIQGKGGTPGYIAPELWFDNFGPISSKADVYSYGKIALEMVYNHLNQCGNLDAYGVTEEIEEVAKKMILVGLWCIQKLPAERPSMSQVVEMLEGRIKDLRMPPNP